MNIVVFGDSDHLARLRPDDVHPVAAGTREPAPGPRETGLPHVPHGTFSVISEADALLVSDTGDRLLMHPEVRVALHLRAHRVPLVWHARPGGPSPVPAARLVTLSATDALEIARPGASREVARSGIEAGEAADPLGAITEAATELLHRWGCVSLAVTLGPGEALLLDRDGGTTRISVGDDQAADDARDPTGANAAAIADRFRATALVALAGGAGLAEATRVAAASHPALAAADDAGGGRRAT